MQKINVLFVVIALNLLLLTACNDPSKPLSREERINNQMNLIRETPDWLANVRKQAEEQKMNLDTAIYRNAVFTIDEQDGKTPKTGATATSTQTREQRIAATVAAIKAAPDWLANVKKQAEEAHISLDSSIMKNAIYTIDQQDGKVK